MVEAWEASSGSGSSPTGDGWSRSSTSTSLVGSSRPTRPSGPAAEPRRPGASGAMAPHGTAQRTGHERPRRLALTDRVTCAGQQLCDRREGRSVGEQTSDAGSARRRDDDRHACGWSPAGRVRLGRHLDSCEVGNRDRSRLAEPARPRGLHIHRHRPLPGRRPPVQTPRVAETSSPPVPSVTPSPTATPSATPTPPATAAPPPPHRGHPHGEAADRAWSVGTPGRDCGSAKLSALGYWLGTPDGSFGPARSRPSTRSRRPPASGASGVVGPKTERALARDRPRPPSAVMRSRNLLGRQLLLVVRARWTILNTSTGNGRPYTSTAGRRTVATTPRGSFTAYRAVDGPVTNSLGELHRPRFFLRGYAVHGSPNIPPWRLRLREAEEAPRPST